MVNALTSSIITLGFDIFSIKLYWVACSALWFYDYAITFDDEVEYAWKGKKTPVFWLFFLNRYLAPCFIIINLVAYFAKSFTLDVCPFLHEHEMENIIGTTGVSTTLMENTKPVHIPLSCNQFNFMKTLETILLTMTAQIFLTLRVYAITQKNKLFPYFSALVLASQWAIALDTMSRSSRAIYRPTLLLSRDPPLPTLPDIDAYRICLFISTLDILPHTQAYLFLSLVFDALAFVIIIGMTIRTSRYHKFMPLTRVIQRDGVFYFFVLFSSNLVWVLLLYYARPALKFMHNSPAMIISAVMINRITLNLKKASRRNSNAAWSITTFGIMPFGDERSTEFDAR